LNKNNLFFILFISCLSTVFDSIAQTEEKPKSYQIKGYVKNLQSLTFNDINLPPLFVDTSIISGNIIHHRFNYKWYLNKNITIAAELRNQLFINGQVQSNPLFAETIGTDNGLLDLSFNFINTSSIVLNSQIDRLWLNWEKKKWAVRIGRQRINWGINYAFNPNDLFNTYSFLDFDYEERPGTDAIKVTYNPNYESSIEFAFSPNKNHMEQSVAAIKYAFNKWQYDFQVIAGYYQQDIALGLGWAGNLKNAGLKGEMMYFISTTDSTTNNYNLSLTYDNVFGSTYFQAAALYNLRGIDKVNPLALVALNSIELSPKNLFPFKYTGIVNAVFTISPLSRATAAMVYSPGVNTLILTPGLSYSIADNWDLDLFLQSFFTELQQFDHFSSNVFLRLKWSY